MSKIFPKQIDWNNPIIGDLTIQGSLVTNLDSSLVNGQTLLFLSSSIDNRISENSSSIGVLQVTKMDLVPEYIDFDTTVPVDLPWKEGRLFYDNEQGALTFYNNEAEISLQIGQEFLLRAYNDTGQPIENGTPVYISGSRGDMPYIWPAVADFHVDNGFYNHIIGLATHTIEDKSVGYVTEQGVVRGVDTEAFAAGDILYVSTVVGELTNIPPEPPLDKIQVGFVDKSAKNGIIFVKPEEPIHFHDISGLSGSNPVEGEVWVYDDVKKVWKNSDTLPNIIASGSFSGSFQGTLDNINISDTLTVPALNVTNATFITGSVYISGSLVVDGQTVLKSGTVDSSSLQVYGEIEVLNQQLSESIETAKITIENLGQIGNSSSGLVMDLGGIF